MEAEKIKRRCPKALTFMAGLIFIYAPLASAYNLEEYYPLAQGNRWAYFEIKDEGMDKKTFRVEGKEIIDGQETTKLLDSYGGHQCLVLDSQGLKEYKDTDVYGCEIYNPPRMLFPNIEIGESREYSTLAINYGADGTKLGESRMSGKITLESVEDIEVPAGRFTGCLKFSSILEIREENGSYKKEDSAIWLAPGLGRVKETCSVTEYEAGGGKENVSFQVFNLVSAVVDGKKIGGQ